MFCTSEYTFPYMSRLRFNKKSTEAQFCGSKAIDYYSVNNYFLT